MSPNNSFTDLMGRLRTGEDAAAQEVFLRFANRLVGLPRGHLDAGRARKVAPEDLVQWAYKSFFVRQRGGGLEVGGWDGLWGLLTVITLRKCADQAERYAAGKRDVRREVGQGADSTAPAAWQAAVDRDPSPDEAAVMAETVEALFRSVADPGERAVLELSLQGYSTQEISDKLGRAERTVRRMRERIGDRLARMRDEG